MERVAVFPGSFDPFTLGHQFIVAEGLRLFDRIVIAIGINPGKNGFLDVAARVRMIEDLYREEDRIEVAVYEGLTAEFCRRTGAKYMLRGMRNTVDFEYERNLMQVNQSLYPEILTVLLFTPPRYVAISSSVIREIYSFGGDTTPFLPEGVRLEDYLDDKKQ